MEKKAVVTLSFGQCCKRMWADALGAWRARPQVALFLLLASLLLWGRLFALPDTTVSLEDATTMQTIYRLLEVCLWYAALVMLPLWVFGVYRFVVGQIVGGGAALRTGWPFDRHWLRTMGWSVVGWAVMAVPPLLLMAVGGFVIVEFDVKAAMKATLLLLALAGAGVSLVAALRISPWYAAIAAGSQASWRAAWRDMRGHFWAAAALYFVAAAGLAAATAAAVYVAVLARKFVDGIAFDAVMPVTLACLSCLVASVHAACAANVYRRCASALLATPETGS
jgi:hypothetical protein